MQGFDMELYGGPEKRKRRNPPDPYWVKYIPQEEKEKIELEKTLKRSLADCGFPARIVNTFEKAGIFTLKQFVEKSEEELKLLSSIGDVTLKQCAKILARLNVTWVNRGV